MATQGRFTYWVQDGVHGTLTKSKAHSFKASSYDSAVKRVKNIYLRYHDGVPVSLFIEDSDGSARFLGLGIYGVPDNYFIGWNGIDAVRKLRVPKK